MGQDADHSTCHPRCGPFYSSSRMWTILLVIQDADHSNIHLRFRKVYSSSKQQLTHQKLYSGTSSSLWSTPSVWSSCTSWDIKVWNNDTMIHLHRHSPLSSNQFVDR